MIALWIKLLSEMYVDQFMYLKGADFDNLEARPEMVYCG